MNNEKPSLPGMAGDKFEIHYRQQLSALIDGELSADEARFMLRRLEHDAELSACHERWLLCGDVLRGQACAPAPLDFAGRVSAALEREPAPENTGQSPAAAGQAARRWLRWGGGTALAASVAALAMFMSREQLPDDRPPAADAAPLVAASAPVPPTPAPAQPQPQPPAIPAGPGEGLGQTVAAVPAAALAISRRQEAAARRSVAATRSQQAARGTAARQQAQRASTNAAAGSAVAVEVAAVAGQDPFGHPAATLQARPWPRSVVAPPAGGGAFNASVSAQSGRTFYPFEPRMPEPVATGDEPLPPLPHP